MKYKENTLEYKLFNDLIDLNCLKIMNILLDIYYEECSSNEGNLTENDLFLIHSLLVRLQEDIYFNYLKEVD